MPTDPLELVRNVKVTVPDGLSVWSGPCAPGEQGGVTQGLLQKFLACRYRFKAYAIDGWRAGRKFNHKIEYGNLFHRAEEVFAETADVTSALDAAMDYAETLADEYPESRADISKWWNVLRVQFPEYVRYWSGHPDVVNRTPLLQEQVFDVPYKLPSGRTVRLRGKWDGVDLIDNGVWLVEHKTKGDVDEQQLCKQLTFDLQTMMYLVALGGEVSARNWAFNKSRDIKGVRYNVVRRPLSGGKGTIVRHKPTKSNPAGESEHDYYERLRAYITEEPATYFFRWTVDVSNEDIARFRREFLDPCLEFVCAWYDAAVNGWYPGAVLTGMPPSALMWRTPFGLVSEIVDGYGSDLDHYLETGSTIGLTRTTDLFPELRN